MHKLLRRMITVRGEIVPRRLGLAVFWVIVVLTGLVVVVLRLLGVIPPAIDTFDVVMVTAFCFGPLHTMVAGAELGFLTYGLPASATASGEWAPGVLWEPLCVVFSMFNIIPLAALCAWSVSYFYKRSRARRQADRRPNSAGQYS